MGAHLTPAHCGSLGEAPHPACGHLLPIRCGEGQFPIAPQRGDGEDCGVRAGAGFVKINQDLSLFFRLISDYVNGSALTEA
jgi:hypothetical protein